MKNSPDEVRTGRREFFRGLLRKGCLAALGVGGAAAVLRHLARSGDHVCINNGICRGCGAFAGCTLPQALSAKEAASEAGSPGTRPGSVRALKRS